MKKLYLVRHAKSSWDDLSDDFERDLNDKGKSDLKLIWKHLKDKKIHPDKVYSSPAKRSEKTCKSICEWIWYSFDKVKFEDDIYNFHMKWIEFYLKLITNFKDKHDEIMIFWHNEAWNQLTTNLLGTDIWNIPTLWVVCIKFDIDSWADILTKKGELEFFVYPKMYY